MALILTSQAEFTALLAKEAEDKELVFFIHGFNVQTKDMLTSTDNMQTNFDSSPQNQPNEVLVVPVDWACTDPEGLFGKTLAPVKDYHPDQAASETAGNALWQLFSGLKKENSAHTLNVIGHSMGNRVLRCVGQAAVPEGDASWTKESLKDNTLLQAAPKDLKSNENFFENIFFVSADIPETVFDEPDGTDIEQAEHALQSGVAALAVMTKRMHVLHAGGHDADLNGSFLLNKGHARLGSRGPWSSGLLGLGEKSAKVWDKVAPLLEYDGIPTPDNENNGNVHVQDCSAWNRKADPTPLGPVPKGHSYQFYPQSVAYYLKHMTKGV